MSAGGADTAVMVWQCSSAADRNTACGESDDSDTDSEEEGGTVDLGLVGTEFCCSLCVVDLEFLDYYS